MFARRSLSRRFSLRRRFRSLAQTLLFAMRRGRQRRLGRLKRRNRLASVFHHIVDTGALLAPTVEGLEDRTLLSVTPSLTGTTVTFTGDAANDSLALRQEASTGNLQYSTDGGTTWSADLDPGTAGTQSLLVANITSLTVSLGGGDDTLTLDFSNGVPIPQTGTTYDGQTQTNSDSLVLTGGSVDGVTHRFDSASSGRVTVSISGTSYVVDYQGLEPITDNLAAANRVFDFTGGSETITLQDGGGAGQSYIDSTLGESVTFANPTASLTLNAAAGLGPDTINLLSLDSAFDADILVNLSNSGDTVNVTGMTGTTNSYAIAGGLSSDTINVQAAAVTRPLSVGGGPGSDTIAVTGSPANETWTASMPTATISGLAGGQTITHGQVETLTFDLAGGIDDLYTIGTSKDEAYVYTPDVTANTSTFTGFDTTTQSVSTVTFTGVENTSFHIDGNGGTDTLQIITPGTEAVTASLDAVQVGSRVPIEFVGISSGQITGGLTGLTLNVSLAGGTTRIESGGASNAGAFTVQSGPRFTFTGLSAGAPITVNGNSGDDQFIFDNLGTALLNAQITFNGAGQTTGDSLKLTRTSGSLVVTNQGHTATGSGSGTIALDSTTTIQYTGLEPIFDDMPATNFTFNTPANAADSVAYENGGSATDTHRIRSTTGAFETYEFRNKANVTVNTGSGASDGADTVTISTTQSALGLTTLAFQTGAGDDAMSVTLPFNGGVTLTSLSVDGQAGSNSLTIDGPTGASNDTYAVTNTQITVTGQQTVTYQGISSLKVNTDEGADTAAVNLNGAGIPGTIEIDGGVTTGTVALTVTGTAGDDTWTVTPTHPGMANDTVVQIGGVSMVRARELAGDLVTLQDGGGLDGVTVVARSTTGQGGAPEVTDGNDTITVTGHGQGTDQQIAITNATQGSLTTVVLADNQFTAGLTVLAGNESASDTITVQPNVDRAVTVQGGNPAAPTVGDQLTVDVSHASAAGATLTVTGVSAGTYAFTGGAQDVSYTSIERTQTSGGTAGATVRAGGGNNAITVNLDGGDLVVTIDGAEAYRAAASSVNAIAIEGEAGDDTLTVDFAGGLPIPSGGLTFDGGANGAGGDSIVLQNGSATDVVYTFTTANDGQIDLDGNTINFTGLEPVTDNL
ncbi:MAG: hypothetical protein GXP27_22200, partial [Planctomycetes bacterium]|nr:hypothetical protein [Planctomycetota bacterium]